VVPEQRIASDGGKGLVVDTGKHVFHFSGFGITSLSVSIDPSGMYGEFTVGSMGPITYVSDQQLHSAFWDPRNASIEELLALVDLKMKQRQALENHG
jgi:hypothetical protein